MIDLHHMMGLRFGNKPREAGRPAAGAGAGAAAGETGNSGPGGIEEKPLLPTSWMDELD